MNLNCSVELLGEKIIENLDKFSINEDKTIGERKSSDWPAFKTSKSTSIKAFETEYIYISFKGANDHNIIAELLGFPEKDAKLIVYSTASLALGLKAKLAESLLTVYQACITRKI